MKNITSSADEKLIQRTRETAQSRHTTLNKEFREWPAAYTASAEASTNYNEIMDGLKRVNAGRTFTRKELNER